MKVLKDIIIRIYVIWGSETLTALNVFREYPLVIRAQVKWRIGRSLAGKLRRGKGN